MTYNKRTLRILSLLGLWALMSLGSAYAQSDTLMTVKAPFPFSVGNKMLPAGEYAVERMVHLNGRLLIRSTDGRASRIILVLAHGNAPASDESALVFHRYGQDYFLAQVWCGAIHSTYELFPSRAEREVAKKASERRDQMVLLTIHPPAAI